MTNKKSLINIELIPESTKESLFNPTAKPLGASAGGIASFVSIPFRKLGIWSEDILTQYETKILEKNLNIPEENRDFSKMHLALKTMEDSKYSIKENELQIAFANLISSTLDDRKNNEVLPSFSSFLKDFTSEDAELFKTLYLLKGVAKVDVFFSNTQNALRLPASDNIILLKDGLIYQPLSLKNLERFGLIEIKDSCLTREDYKQQYQDFKSSKKYSVFVSELEHLKEYDTLYVQEGHIKTSELGNMFGSVVVS